jgi:RecA-family ATPase
MLFGAPKSGKSYVALHVAWSYATGTRWFRRKCQSGQVLYLAGEGVSDLQLRAQALVEDTNTHPGGFIRWWTDPLSLSRERDAAKLRLEVERCAAGLVIVDTWRRFSGLVDENDSGAAATAMGALEDLARSGVSVLVVHHTNSEGGIRGSTAVHGAVESAVRVMHNPDLKQMELTPYLTRRGVGFSPIQLGWQPTGPDAVLREVHV